jgi:hypothetical protein
MNTDFLCSVLAPGDFDRASIKPSAPASERVAFPNATSVATLPFSSVSFATDLEAYTTTPELLKTYAAVPTPKVAAATTTGSAGATSSQPAQYTGSSNGVFPNVVTAISAAMVFAVFLV